MIRIITDSTCDIDPKRVAQLGVRVVPLTVNFGKDSYIDGVELSIEEFYNKLATTQELPTTSQVNPADFETVFKEYAENGDEIVGLFISSKLSGTYQSAVIAKETLQLGNIYLVDTLTVSFGLHLMVDIAAKMRDQGCSAKSIAEKIENLSRKNRLIASLDTLKYLKMGGRLSSTAAFVGSVLGISPIITLTDGAVTVLGKARGQKGAFKLMLDYMQEHGRCKEYPVSFGHSNSQEALNKCIDYFASEVGDAQVLTGNIGCIVGTHAGPGAVGVAYIEP
ncbi:MAG: DegV family protein [Christensenellales bacterium]